jgi:hypothetical protein
MLSKGQVTAEFMSVMAIVSIVFLVAISFISQEKKATAQNMWEVDARYGAQRLAEGINAAYIAGSGSVLNVSLPKALVGGANYSISLRPRLVTLSVPAYGREFEWKYAGADVQGALGGLNLSGGPLRIVNVNGTINVTNYYG